MRFEIHVSRFLQEKYERYAALTRQSIMEEAQSLKRRPEEVGLGRVQRVLERLLPREQFKDDYDVVAYAE